MEPKDMMAIAKVAGNIDINGVIELAAQLGAVLGSIERHLSFQSFALSKLVGQTNPETNEFEPSDAYTAIVEGRTDFFQRANQDLVNEG